jgi:predicted nucleic acid-binding protein
MEAKALITLMFDSNVWDKLVNDSQALSALEAYVKDGLIEVLTTSVQEKENESAPSYSTFQQLKERLRTRNVASEGFVLGFARWDVDKFGREDSKWVTKDGTRNRDEVIGQTAERHGAVLITEDKEFRKDASSKGLKNYSLSELLDELKHSLP